MQPALKNTDQYFGTIESPILWGGWNRLQLGAFEFETETFLIVPDHLSGRPDRSRFAGKRNDQGEFLTNREGIEALNIDTTEADISDVAAKNSIRRMETDVGEKVFSRVASFVYSPSRVIRVEDRHDTPFHKSE